MNKHLLDQSSIDILAVDDTRANLRLLTSILTEQGYNVRPVPNGRLALSSVEAKPPDLILLDIDMPEMTGFEVCERLKADERFQDIPVLFISVLSDTTDKVKAFSVGGVDYITKPFQAEEVLARVQTHLALNAMQQYLKKQNVLLQQEVIERQKAEKGLIAMRDQALVSSQLKDEILSRVSHELRTPLSIILGYSDILREGAYGPILKEQDQILAEIMDSSQKLTRIVDELLTQAEFEVNQVRLENTVFDLNVLLSRVEAQMRILAEAKGLAIQTEVDWKDSPVISGDKRWLEHILINLIDNAIKFTKMGGVTIKCSSNGVEFWCVQVKDTGIGISKQDQARIFEPFDQVDGSTTRPYGGMGLGLSIVHGLTKLMGGTIMVESEIGSGSTFRITFPLEASKKCLITEKRT
ncbi:MAG: hybrid sensor histidine kinase/response regulator [Chloroflexota bacterium]